MDSGRTLIENMQLEWGDVERRFFDGVRMANVTGPKYGGAGMADDALRELFIN